MENGLDDSDDVYSYLKLTAPKSEDDDKGAVTISGSFLWWDKIGTFKALVRDKNETANYWDIDQVEWADVPEDVSHPGPRFEGDAIETRQLFGHGLTVLKTLDDKGCPFVELIYNDGPQETIRALGKKQKSDDGSLGLTCKEAERLMKDGVADELDGSESQSMSDESDDEVGEGEGASRSPVTMSELERLQVKTIGTKRKAEDEADDLERRPALRTG